MEVTKVPPLKCPQCGSVEVKAGFNKRVGKAYVRDGKIWCYACGLVTLANGKTREHRYRANDFDEDCNAT